jgi:hypothetical protein
MALDYQTQVSLGLMAGTLAQWLRDNPEARDLDEKGLGDADEFGMYALSTGFLRMYHELLQANKLELLSKLKAPEGSKH